MAKQTFTTGQVLTAAQMTSLQQTAMLGGAASAKTASYTLVAADAGTAISMSNAGATTITVNTALFAAGDTVHITNLGAGVCTITAGTATVNTSASLALAQYESGFLDFTSTSAAIFVKGAGAAAASGGMTSLASGSLAASGTGFDLTSISGSYNELWLYIINYSVSTATDIIIRTNNNSSADYSFTFVRNGLSTVGGTTGESRFILNDQVSDTQAGLSAVVRFPNYANTTGFKNCEWVATKADDSQRAGNGFTRSTSAINRITFLTTGGTFDAGTYELFGVK